MPSSPGQVTGSPVKQEISPVKTMAPESEEQGTGAQDVLQTAVRSCVAEMQKCT